MVSFGRFAAWAAEHRSAPTCCAAPGGGALGEALETRIVLNSQVAIWFEQAVYEFDVPIGTPAGTPLGSVTASVSVPGTYVYFSGGTGPFQLNWDGLLTVSSQVYGSEGEVITFTAWADTMEGPAAQSTVQITLTESVFAPVQFTQPLYQFTVPLGTPAHTFIGDVAITGGEYPWISGYHSLFAVNSTADPRSAQVMTTADVYGNVGDTISFQVTAGDMFTSASATVEITYTPGVTHLPEFLSHDGRPQPEISADWYEFNAQTLGTLAAFDLDYMDPLTFFGTGSFIVQQFDMLTYHPTGNPFTVLPDGSVEMYGPQVLIPGALYQFTAYVSDEANFDPTNPDMTRTDSAVVRVQFVNTPPMVQDEGPYESVGGDVIWIPVQDLLQNDYDLETSIDEDSFQITETSELRVKKIGQQILVWPRNEVGFSAQPIIYLLPYSVADTHGARSTGNITIRVLPAPLKQAWLATINRVEAEHVGYMYYTEMHLAVFFTILRNNAAENATYGFGVLSGANAVYSPFWNHVTVDNAATSLNPATVIHETVHIVDDYNNWYLSDYGTHHYQFAERLAWTGEHFVSDPYLLRRLQALESLLMHSEHISIMEITAKWDNVVSGWEQFPLANDYTYPWNTAPIGVAGVSDLFGKCGVRGLS
jgi:hypothetical protein